MILPAMGMVSDIIATFSRKPLFGYKPMVFALAGIAGLGFIVWGHHMFQSGMNPALGATFMLSTMMIALPSAIKVFNWLGTMWGGRLQFTSAMLNAMAFVAMFVIGGLSGIFMAATPVDMHIHDTYFIVGPHYNYAKIPTVYHPPYEYSIPGVEDDFLPQTEPLPAGIVLDPVMA